MEIFRFQTKKGWIAAGCAVLLTGLLSSCSLFECSLPPPKAKPPLPVVTEPVKPDLPYTETNWDFPLSQVNHPKIYVYKGERKFLLVQDRVLIREYRCGLGPHPNGDKSLRGDGRTPEGLFYICVKNRGSKFHKSMGLSYPAARHGETGLVCGLVSPEE